MHVDHLVIGAGPSGLACALRLALSGAKVALVEKHRKVGGLNSYYARPYEKNGEKLRLELDSGLHAITNYSVATQKSSTLNKLFRALRIDRNQLELCEQNYSLMQLGEKILTFTNSINDLTKSIEKNYPHEIIGWDQFLKYIDSYNEFDPNQVNYLSAKMELKKFFKNDEFINHLLFPVLTYGSAWEEDMDFNLYICLFRSMFLEGFSRPKGGIRSWWKQVTENLEKYGVTMFMGESVTHISPMENHQLRVTTSQREIVSGKVYSSAGLIETQKFFNDGQKDHFEDQASKLGFIELIVVFDEDFKDDSNLPTLAFCALDKDKYFHATNESINTDMAIYCLPSRYQDTQKDCEGMIRMTCITNPVLWFNYTADEYKIEKNNVKQKMLEQLLIQFPQFKNSKILLTDIFTPKTIHKYTSHHLGSLYGSTLKVKEGKSSIANVYYIGSDHGYPGITGSMLSGVAMANHFGIMNL